MATESRKPLYEEDDVVDEHLLSKLSKWILYHRLGALARDLGISQTEFSRIAMATSQPEEQIFRVRDNMLRAGRGLHRSASQCKYPLVCRGECLDLTGLVAQLLMLSPKLPKSQILYIR